jgi:hypothetical protein
LITAATAGATIGDFDGNWGYTAKAKGEGWPHKRRRRRSEQSLRGSQTRVRVEKKRFVLTSFVNLSLEAAVHTHDVILETSVI